MIQNPLNNKIIEFPEEKDGIDLNIINTMVNRTLIIADIAGSGKSYLCKMFCKQNNKKPLFVVNNNDLCFELITEGYTAITPYKLLGINFK
jgi:hypothetical protein